MKIPGSPLAARPFGIWLAGFVIRVIERDAPPPSPDPSIPGSPNCDPARWRLCRQGCTAPGILYLLNTRTRDLITWKTGESDSEIVLVTDREVLYRVGTRLYRATIGQAAHGPPELVIDSMEVLDLHWAFWGPEPSFPAKGNAQ